MAKSPVLIPGRETYHFAQLRKEVGDLGLIGLMDEYSASLGPYGCPGCGGSV